MEDTDLSACTFQAVEMKNFTVKVLPYCCNQHLFSVKTTSNQQQPLANHLCNADVALVMVSCQGVTDQSLGLYEWGCTGFTAIGSDLQQSLATGQRMHIFP